MATAGSLQLSPDLGIYKNRKCSNNSQNITGLKNPQFCGSSLSSLAFGQSLRTTHKHKIYPVPYKYNNFRCNSVLNPPQSINISTVKNFTVSSLTRSYQSLQQSQYALKLIQAAGIVVFTIWGLGPLIRQIRKLFVHNDGNWKKSATYNIMTSYIQPLLLWTGAILVCRALDPLVLPTEASQAVKTRLINFVKSLSTVLSCAYCLSGTIQEVQKFFMETSGPTDARNMGFQFAGKAVYSAVWVAALSLFMELLGFSTQKWLTAGGLGTVLLTLAGREIFTNFLSSAIIHATRPFVKTEWIQTKIEGYEVSGTVEHVGWWSPTVIRGEDREAVYIPNHKFTVNVVRNLTQKTHWRIKTHLAISHLDVAKINIIVADMRKVLAKSPQVEQQKLHRRVFLDFINPENQALSILVSCFVKTSHFEEYLCVKEAILLDLLRVIRHHRARLATPIRTVQKVFTDADLDDIPHAVDSVFNGGSSVTNRPLLLIEPSYKVNGEDKTTKSTTKSTPPDQSKEESKSRTTKATESKTGKQAKVGPVGPSSESDSSSASTTITKSSLEENIILGVALEGSKRTLPIEESMALTEKELAPVTGKEKIDNKNNNNNNQNSSSSSSSSTINDQSDQTSYGTEAI